MKFKYNLILCLTNFVKEFPQPRIKSSNFIQEQTVHLTTAHTPTFMPPNNSKIYWSFLVCISSCFVFQNHLALLTLSQICYRTKSIDRNLFFFFLISRTIKSRWEDKIILLLFNFNKFALWIWLRRGAELGQFTNLWRAETVVKIRAQSAH